MYSEYKNIYIYKIIITFFIAIKIFQVFRNIKTVNCKISSPIDMAFNDIDNNHKFKIFGNNTKFMLFAV